MSRIFISAAHKSSGKTTISIGLCAALTQHGKHVQSFKKGPDYIDPMWLSAASQRPCHNLDFYTMQHEEMLHVYQQHQTNVDINLIEGNKGLYDGLDLDGSNSNAALASLLKAPVILVIDARGMTRGIAPLILGYQAFDQDIHIAGVILNQLGGHRHEQKLRRVIEHYTDVPVLGAVHHNDDVEIVERHLGLMPSNEFNAATKKIDQLSNMVREQVDLERIISIASQAPALDTFNAQPIAPSPAHIKIGVARDAAFGFYYPGDLEVLKQHGAELIEIDLLHDAQLPDIDGLFIGGGFPETQMTALEENQSMRHDIKQKIEAGLPCYAECGGLMYLARSITWKGQQHSMAGVIPGDIMMHSRPQGRGYIKVKETNHMPWPISPNQTVIHGHEFHYSSIKDLPADTRFAFEVKRGTGIDGQHDGIIYKNLLASYAHLRHTAQSPWASQFVQFISQHRNQKVANS